MFKKNANSLSLTIKKLLGNIVHGFVWFMNKSLIKKNLTVITFCILFILDHIFFPYQFYASADRNSGSSFKI